MPAWRHDTPSPTTASASATGDPGEIAPLVAEFYAEAEPPVREQLLRTLLTPLGPLALAGIAAGAFAALLPQSRWQGPRLTPEALAGIGSDAVLDLARYVQQKSPEILLRLPELLGDPRTLMATVSGGLLLLSLRRWRRGGLQTKRNDTEPKAP